MWTRTSSNYVRTHGLRLGATRSCARVESLGKYTQRRIADAEPSKFAPNTLLKSSKFGYSTQVPAALSFEKRYLSSQAGEKSSGEESDELDEGFSELEAAEASTPLVGNVEENDELNSDEEDVERPSESDSSSAKKSSPDNLGWLILKELKSVQTVLDNYLSEHETLDKSEISSAMATLRRRHMYRKALQFSEWLEAKKVTDLDERYYASRLDLVAKVHGIPKAERYLESIPESSRDEVVYRTLLANCVSTTNAKKAEEVFNKMKQLNFITTAFTCNQMIMLYKKIDKKKIADVLLYMEKEDVKPTIFTYKLLVDTKGQARDIAGMDQIIETMKADGVEPDDNTKAILAKHYVAAGLKEKAETVLQEIEGSNLSSNRAVCGILIPLYASLGKADEVERVWKVCEPKPQYHEYMAVIDAWGKLKQIEKAEAVFEKLEKTKKLSSGHYSAMLRVYANSQMLNKGKDLVKRMGENGCRIGPLTWDALVKLYVEAGEVEKADVILQKAMSQNNKVVKPLFSSFMTIMEHYAKRGDVHNSEKMFSRLKQAGYTGRLRPFENLLQAYARSKTPVYGFRERMMAENVFPSRAMGNLLSQTDPFKRTAVSDLLD